ncbi:MAG: glycosyltransferase family 4 protein [Planctomycetia bacterium]|nr:glycosyltransferase family 4 protein [Planctomycetia bacterium]
MSAIHSMTARPRKVLHVLNSAGGGAALSTLGLIGMLRADGIGACAVCHDAGTAAEREHLRDAVGGAVLFTRLYWWNRKIRMPLWKRPLAEAKQILATGWSISSAARVAEFATRMQAHLIHTNTILTPEGGLAAHRLGLPHVWHLREMLGPGQPFRLWREGPSLGRYLAQYCSKLVANSQASAAQVRDWLPDDLLEVVPNGIDVSRFRVRSTPDRGGPIVVAMVGNLTSRWKKHGLFIEAAALVDRQLPIRWRIYGHDPSQAGRRVGDAYVDGLHAEIARAGMSDRFEWPGFVAEPADIMSQVDLLVHPADSESFGRVVVEAMAAGLPVVGVRAGGVGDIVEHGVTGLLAKKDDPRDLAACIDRLARDPALRRGMGLAGRQRAEGEYSLAACAAKIVRVYELAMARPLKRAIGLPPSVAVAHSD